MRFRAILVMLSAITALGIFGGTAAADAHGGNTGGHNADKAGKSLTHVLDKLFGPGGPADKLSRKL